MGPRVGVQGRIVPRARIEALLSPRSLVLVGDGSTCVQDCADVWGGPSTVDACGTCDADPGNDCP